MFSVQKALGFELSDVHLTKGADDGGPNELGVFTGYASTFGNADRDGDVVLPGAFGEIDVRRVKMLRQHKHADLIGVWKSIKSDSHGLLVTGHINLDVQLGRETYSLMKQGALDSMSVGMGVPRDQYEEKEVSEGGRKRKVKHIKKALLHEISLVTIPANPQAVITSVKSDELFRLPTIREFEAALRDAEWSRKERAQDGRAAFNDYVAFLKKWNFIERDADDDAALVRDAEDRAAEDAALKAKSEAEAVEKAAAEAEAIRKAIADAFGGVLAKL